MILVTGGTGLLGSHLIYELCKNGEKIRATKRANSSTDFVKWVFGLYSQNIDELFGRIEWVDADLLDYESLVTATANIETVYHTGAIVSFNPSQANAIGTTNVVGTANLIVACLQNGVKNICHVSSVASLGEANIQGITDENCKWTKSKGQSAYAKSKFLGENEAWRAHEQGIRVIIVNPSVILGPGRWENGSGQLFQQVNKFMPFYTEGVSGYVDVRDVAKAMVLLMQDTSISGERFVLNSQNLSFQELFTLMAKSLGKKSPRIKISPWVIDMAYPFVYLFGVLSGKGNSVSKANMKSAFSKTYYSSDKIKSRLGFIFTPISETVEFVSSVYLKDLDRK
jgi:nucleoside-diphosphate-sugar epimerase